MLTKKTGLLILLDVEKFLKSLKDKKCTASEVSKYGVFSDPYSLVFELNTEIYRVNLRIQSNTGKYGPEKTSHLDTFHAVIFHDN